MNRLGRLVVFLSVFACLPFALRGGAVSPAYAGNAYAAKVATIPGVIQSELYDVASGNAPDVTFHYNGGPRQTPWRVSADSIGLAGFGTGHVSVDGKPENPSQFYAGWTQVGEWWAYTVKVEADGTYRIGGHFASGSKDARLVFTFTPKADGVRW